MRVKAIKIDVSSTGWPRKVCKCPSGMRAVFGIADRARFRIGCVGLAAAALLVIPCPFQVGPVRGRRGRRGSARAGPPDLSRVVDDCGVVGEIQAARSALAPPAIVRVPTTEIPARTAAVPQG